MSFIGTISRSNNRPSRFSASMICWRSAPIDNENGHIPSSGGRTHQTPLAQKHYDSTAGQWLHEAANIDFKGSISPLVWILKNKPKEEIHSVSFLILAVGCGNPKIREGIRRFEIPASAYSYLKGNLVARKELTRVYNSLLKKGKRSADIDYVMMKQDVNRSIFNYKKNDKRQLSAGYFKSIIKVYLHFAQDFRDMDVPKQKDDPETIMKKWLDAGNDWNIK